MKELDFLLLRYLRDRHARRQATNARPSSSFSNCPIRISHDICWRAMSHPIPATPHCAASCSRIELVPRARRGDPVVCMADTALCGHAVRRGAARGPCASPSAWPSPLREFAPSERSCCCRAGAQCAPSNGRTTAGSRCGSGPNRIREPAHPGFGIIPPGRRKLGFALRDAIGHLPGARRRIGSGRSGFPAPLPVPCPAARGRLPGAERAPLLPSGPRFEVRHAPLKIIRLAAPEKETFGGVQGLFSSKGAGVLL